MKTITMILSVCLLAACSACDETEREPVRELRLEVVSIEYQLQGPTQAYGWYVLRMRIHGPNVAQEVRLERPGVQAQIVEFFHVGGDHIDTHSGFRGETREMLMYPASVEGVTMAGDWTILASNIDNSFVTSGDWVGELDNGFEGQTPTGRVSKADTTRAIHWRIEAREDRVYLWINGVEHPLPEPS